MTENLLNDTDSKICLDEFLPNTNDFSTDIQLPEENNEISIRELLLKNDVNISEIQARAVHAADKALSEGIKALTGEERLYYAYFLVTHSYKKNAKGEASKPIHKAIADLVLLDLDIFILNGDAYIYNNKNGTFERDENGKRVCGKIRSLLEFEFIEDKIITAIYNLIMTDEKITISDNDINLRPAHWVHFTNGYYDYKTDSLYNHNPKYHEIGVIPWEYSESKYPTTYKLKKIGSGSLTEILSEPLLFNSWLNEAIPNIEDQKMILQYIGYAMTLETTAQKFLMICGSGGTGKSTLLSIIEKIIGRNNISCVSLQGLQERFTPAELYLKQANICADIPLSALSEIDMIKKLTGEDLISAERKFKNNFNFKSFARLFFSANDIPVNLSDKSNAFYRRMLILKMDKAPEVVDIELSKKLESEIPNIITRAMEELYLSEGVIEESENSKRLVKEAYKNSDTVEAFISDRCILDEKAKTDRASLYSAYYNYCLYEDRKNVTKSNFYKQLESKGFPSRRNKTNFDVCGIEINNVINMPGVNNYSSAGLSVP
ncbi:MAG: hypothetical protein IJO01_02345 [Oscillospiraceae bacterium]|nr:hypothetical protein [Oscillospiraceae bacterium]